MALLAILFAACGNSDTDTPILSNQVAVQFASNIKIAEKKATRAYDNTWEANDAIGVTMLKAGTNVISEGADNRKYITNTAGSNGIFSPATDNTIYYPQDGSKVDFIAYYPYSENVNNFIYPIDVSTQDILANIDLLHAEKVVDKGGNSPIVALQFQHKLSKLVLNVSAEDASLDLSNMTITVNGMATESTFNLVDGTFGASENIKPIVIKKQGLAYEAILIPVSTIDATHTVEFTAGDKVYKWNMNENLTNLDSANEYTYNIILKQAAAQEVEVSGTITDWISNTPGSGTANEEKPNLFVLSDSSFEDADLSKIFSQTVPQLWTDVWTAHVIDEYKNNITFTVAADPVRGKVAEMTNDENVILANATSWKSFIAQRVSKIADPEIYRLSFWAKRTSVSEGVNVAVRIFVKINAPTNKYFIFDTGKPESPTGKYTGYCRNIPLDTDEWTYHEFDVDFSKTTTNMGSFVYETAEVATIEDLTNYAVCIQNNAKSSSVQFDDINLIKVSDIGK